MCIIIDTNCFSRVFDKNSAEHLDFQPVLNWVVNGHGKFVFGGSKYMGELRNTKYIKIFKIFNDLNKVIKADSKLVDKEQEVVEQTIPIPDFDDPHLPAIVRVTGCMLICSKDTRSVKYVTRPELYPRGIKRPKYYTSIRNKKLLQDKYIPDCYKPYQKINKEKKGIIDNSLSILIKKKSHMIFRYRKKKSF